MGRTSNAKDRLLNSAKELIFGRSYSAVGINELCSHAGVQKGSFYHYFPTKREMILEVIDDQWEKTTKPFLEIAFTKKIPPLERIERFFRLISRAYEAMYKETGKVIGCPFGNLTLELSTEDEVIRRKLEDIFEKWTSYIEIAIKEAIETGEITDTNPKTLANAVLAYLEGVLLIAKARNDVKLIGRLGKEGVNLIHRKAS